MRFLFVLITFFVYSLIHDLLIKWIYCRWKHKHNNGFRCYYYTCKRLNDCKYNGNKKRNVFGFPKG